MTEQQQGPVADASGRVLDQIHLVGLEARGYHGVIDLEKRDGQTFRADVTVWLDTRPAAASDDLEAALDYSVLAEQVVEVLTGPAADLIETVAERIAAAVLAWPQVAATDVTVHKPFAPVLLAFTDIAVRIRRDRTNPPVVAAGVGAPPRPVTVEPGQPVDVPVLEPLPPGAIGAVTEVEPSVPLPGTGSLLEVPSVPVPPVPPVPAAVAVPPAPVVAPISPPEEPAAPEELAAPEEPAAVGAPSGPLDTQAIALAPEVAASDPIPDPTTDHLDDAPASPVDVVLALGSNLGDSQETLRQAVAALDSIPGLEVTAVSPLARTRAVGGPADQPDFLNAVVLARTELAPRALLRAAQSVEAAHARDRSGERWGPRTLDIDLVQYGTVLAVTDDLELPHPRAHERAFVLQPWAEVDPAAVLLGLGGGPVSALAATAPDREGLRWMALDWLEDAADGS